MVLRDHKDLRDLLDLVEAWDDDQLLMDIMFEPNGSVKNHQLAMFLLRNYGLIVVSYC